MTSSNADTISELELRRPYAAIGMIIWVVPLAIALSRFATDRPAGITMLEQIACLSLVGVAAYLARHFWRAVRCGQRTIGWVVNKFSGFFSAVFLTTLLFPKSGLQLASAVSGLGIHMILWATEPRDAGPRADESSSTPKAGIGATGSSGKHL